MNFKKSLKLWNEGKKGMNLRDDIFSVSDRNFRITSAQGYKKTEVNERVKDIKTLMKFYENYDIDYGDRLLLKTYETAFYFKFDVIDANKEYSFQAKIYFGDPKGRNGLIGYIGHKNKIIAYIRGKVKKTHISEFIWVKQINFKHNKPFEPFKPYVYCCYGYHSGGLMSFQCNTYIDFIVANAICHSGDNYKTLSEREEFTYKLLLMRYIDVPNDILKIISKYSPLDFPYYK